MAFEGILKLDHKPQMDRLAMVLDEVIKKGYSDTPSGPYRLNMKCWRESDQACAVGLCSLHSWFHEHGLFLLPKLFGYYPSFGDLEGHEAVASFFGLSAQNSSELFASTAYTEHQAMDPTYVRNRLAYVISGHTLIPKITYSESRRHRAFREAA